MIPSHSRAIDLDKLAMISEVGVRRASVFLGLGVNAARDNNFNAYQLTHLTLIQIVPPNLPTTDVDEFKKHFEAWIIGNALREVVENFERFLDGVDAVCRRVELAKQSGRDGKLKILKSRKKFEQAGIDEKLEHLRKTHAITTGNERYFKAIKQARNCVTHRGGLVGSRDVGDNPTLRLTWWRIRVFLKGDSGKETELDAPFPLGGVVLDEESKVNVQLKDRVREFKKGARIEFTAQDVAEICQLTKMTSAELLVSLVEWLERQGVKVHAKSKDERGS